MLKKPFSWKLASYPLFHRKTKIHYEEKQPTTWPSAHDSDSELSWDFQDHHHYQNVLVDNECDDPLYANVMSEIYEVPAPLVCSEGEGDYANIMFNKDHAENAQLNSNHTASNGCDLSNSIYENANATNVCANGGVITGHDLKNGVLDNGTAVINAHNIYENAVTLIAVGDSSAAAVNGVNDCSTVPQNGVSESSATAQNGVSESSATAQNGVSDSSVTAQNGVGDSSIVAVNGVTDYSVVPQNVVGDSSIVAVNGVTDYSVVPQNVVGDSSAVAVNGVGDSSAIAVNVVTDSSAVAVNGVTDSSSVAVNGVTDSSSVAVNGVTDSSSVAVNGVTDSSSVAVNGVTDSSSVAVNGVTDSSSVAVNGVTDSSAVAVNGVTDSSAVAVNGVTDSSAVAVNGVGDVSLGDGNAVGDSSEVLRNVNDDSSDARKAVMEKTATIKGVGEDLKGISEKVANTPVEAVNGVSEITDSVIKSTEEVAKAEDCVTETVESAPVIEISDDGSWETKELQETSKDQDQDRDQDQEQESGEDARRVVMEEQTVRARKIDSWLRDKDTQGDVVYDSILQNKHKTKSYWEQRMMAAEAEAEVGVGVGVGPKIVQAVAKPPPPLPPRTAAMIALELREMKAREEELRSSRARHEPDEGSCSEYGSEDKNSVDGSPHGFSHQRTQSLDSMSSGHSSGSDFNMTRHRIMVKPLDEPQEDEIPVYMRMGHKTVPAVPVLHNSDTDIRRQGETPIEREIRLAREREEELRREKGLPPVSMSNNTNKTEYRRSISRNALNNSDPRSVQHRLATSRIQQEINEATERERELRAAGTIQTTSEDTVDSKLTRFTDLADFAIEERERKMKKSVSTSNIPVEVRSEPESSPPVVTPAFRVGTLYNSNRASGIVSTKRFSPASGNKGLMQRFYASHGKVNMISPIRPVLNSPIIASTPVSPAPVSNANVHTPVVARKPIEVAMHVEVQSVEDGEEEIQPTSVRTPVRRGYQSAEEKIQAELQEMQRREEELRLQRAQMFALSHPNLSSIGKDEDDHVGHLMNGSHTSSNPNLLDSEDSSSLELLDSSLEMQPHRNTGRRRIALIQEWENRIMMNTEH